MQGKSGWFRVKVVWDCTCSSFLSVQRENPPTIIVFETKQNFDGLKAACRFLLPASLVSTLKFMRRAFEVLRVQEREVAHFAANGNGLLCYCLGRRWIMYGRGMLYGYCRGWINVWGCFWVLLE